MMPVAIIKECYVNECQSTIHAITDKYMLKVPILTMNIRATNNRLESEIIGAGT